jgi:integrase
MATRKDNKKRTLKKGEYQKADGRYEYRYKDHNGKARSVYSWRLTPSDKVPVGKPPGISLRELERQIEKDVLDDVVPAVSCSTTLNEMFEKNMESRNLKQSTRTNYTYMYDHFVRPKLGDKKISTLNYSTMKSFFVSLLRKGLKPNSLESVYTILHPVFTDAVRDGEIRLNPTDGLMGDIKRAYNWEKPKRHALTEAEQESFINFLRNSRRYRKWLPLFTVCLGTGARIGEILGLRWEDIDFNNDLISINHSLVYRLQDDGTCAFHVTTPKTAAGVRTIPMIKDVKGALLEEYMSQRKDGFNTDVIDGCTGFIFKNRFGNVINFHCVNRVIERVRKAHDEQEMELAKKENRQPLLLPYFTSHHLRHTFCTRLCENETNLKVIQEIMGHADITTTMDVYNEASLKQKKKSMANLEGKIKIS